MFNVIDIVFIIIILIFAITAAAKGFVKEIFNKISWIAGIIIGCLFAKKLQPFLVGTVKNEFLALLAAFLLIFIVVFLVIQIIKTIIGQAFEGDIMKGLDKSLGFFLGIVEGFAVVMLIIIISNGQTLIPVEGIFANSFFYKLIQPLIPSTTNLIPKEYA
ncbi:MAG: CvpA family protein [Treponema sp.]|nr:CvpA family protein [Treponema sp.]